MVKRTLAIGGLVGICLVATVGYAALTDVHTSAVAALRGSEFAYPTVEIVAEQPTWFGKAVVFEDKVSGQFGIAKVHRSLGLFWRAGGGGFGDSLEPGQPFKVSSYFTENNMAKDQFIAGIKVAKEILYVVVGPTRSITPVEPSLASFQAQPSNYTILELGEQKYGLVVLDNKIEWMVWAYDQQGVLVATSTPDGNPTWVKKP